MQGIAYLTPNGKPRLAWPAQVETEILDVEGNPTDETETTNNLQELIAALPPGTDYILVTEDEAESWWQAHVPAKEKIQGKINALETRQTPRMLRGAALGKTEDKEMLAAIEAEIEELRAEMAGVG